MTLRLLCLPAALSLLALGALPACGGEASTTIGPADAATTMKHSCTVMVARKSPVYSGTASGDDPARTEEAAWADVCARLPEPERAGCRDEKQFVVARSGGPVDTGAGTRHTTSITLTAIVPTVEGKAESQTSKQEACTAALQLACEAAGAPGDCLAGGKFEMTGEISSSKRSPGK